MCEWTANTTTTPATFTATQCRTFLRHVGVTIPKGSHRAELRALVASTIAKAPPVGNPYLSRAGNPWARSLAKRKATVSISDGWHTGSIFGEGTSC